MLFFCVFITLSDGCVCLPSVMANALAVTTKVWQYGPATLPSCVCVHWVHWFTHNFSGDWLGRIKISCPTMKRKSFQMSHENFAVCCNFELTSVSMVPDDKLHQRVNGAANVHVTVISHDHVACAAHTPRIITENSRGKQRLCFCVAAACPSVSGGGGTCRYSGMLRSVWTHGCVLDQTNFFSLFEMKGSWHSDTFLNQPVRFVGQWSDKNLLLTSSSMVYYCWQRCHKGTISSCCCKSLAPVQSKSN